MTKIGFNEIYPFATENVKGYFSNIGIKNKTVLTVGSSLDQAFNAYLFGAKNVTVLDINPHTENFYRIKKQAILKVPREELDQVHLPDPVLNDISMLQKENQALRKEIEMIKDILNNR